MCGRSTSGTAASAEFSGLHKDVEAQHLLAEVAFVEGVFEDGFVERLQFGESEVRGEQSQSEGGVLELAPDALQAFAEDEVVVVGEGRQAPGFVPDRLGVFGAGVARPGDIPREHQVGGGNATLCGIAGGVGEGVDLLKVGRFLSGGLPEATACGIVEGFLWPGEGSRKCELLGIGELGEPNQTDFETPLHVPEAANVRGGKGALRGVRAADHEWQGAVSPRRA